MKHHRFILFLGILMLTLLSGGSAGAEWKVVVPQKLFAEKLRIAAFDSENFGLNGGAGNIGKARFTTDGGATWTGLTLPEGVSRVAAISTRTPADGYMVDDKGILYVTNNGGKTWTSRSPGLENPSIMDFVSGGFVNEIPQAAVRFTDADNGVVVMRLSGKTSMIALRTADGGKTWKEESLSVKLFGAPYISRDGKFVTINKWGEGTTLLKYG